MRKVGIVMGSRSDLPVVEKAIRVLQEYEVEADMINVLEDHKYSVLKDNVTILLGRNIYMEEKISELGNLQDKLSGLSGILHLENYDSSKESIIFTKD